MDSIKKLFRVVPPENRAAHTISVVQGVLEQMLQTGAQQVRATSIRGGQVIVQVQHPVWAAKIRLQESAILQAVNKNIEQRVTGQGAIQKIVCRTTELR